jgi:Ca2+-binding EF-hand superfamily protein
MKAISKIGITGFTDKNLLDLFDVYDSDRCGELSYKEFVGALYGNSSISKKVADENKRTPVKAEYSDENRNLMQGKSKKAFLQIEG